MLQDLTPPEGEKRVLQSGCEYAKKGGGGGHAWVE